MNAIKTHLITLIAIVVFNAPSKAQSSVNEYSGSWDQSTSWAGGVIPGTISSGTMTATTKVMVIRGTIQALYNANLVSSNLSIDAGDTLVILGNLTSTLSSLTNNGVLIVYGDMSNSLSNNTISGTGKMVVTGDYNNALGGNTFTGPSYILGNTNGFLFTPSVEDETDLANDDPGLQSYVENLYVTLPVELVSFDVVMDDRKAVVSWETSTETNNDYFIIERSIDGITFDSLVSVQGSGESHELLYYSFVDGNPLVGRSYYRLSQVDYHGALTHHNIVSLENTDVNQIKFYPNPVADFIFTNVDLTNFSISIKDTQGVDQYGISTNIDGLPAIDIHHVESGVYFLTIYDNRDQTTKSFRFVKR